MKESAEESADGISRRISGGISRGMKESAEESADDSFTSSRESGQRDASFCRRAVRFRPVGPLGSFRPNRPGGVRRSGGTLPLHIKASLQRRIGLFDLVVWSFLHLLTMALAVDGLVHGMITNSNDGKALLQTYSNPGYDWPF